MGSQKSLNPVEIAVRQGNLFAGMKNRHMGSHG
ncbi:hypothetical protein Pla123a_17570 [Posidoniimonas polymericola]|uniref:Uncharacterized protein n=1 Tax=Posidoniimonas polymericola TaxID=2528002 RepID=A0A5C5YSR8_9BACT|nr:hypothetical protein Pla123a_17570 [Posidoniimonas polymericola]